MEPSDREIWRGIEAADPEPGELDRTKVWRAFLNGTSPREMDTDAEANQIRKWWCWQHPADEEDVADMNPEEIEQFDDWISRSGSPF